MSAVAASPALAHPHVWVSTRSELVYGSDGKVSVVRHHWTFDEGYSAVAIQGLDANGDGKVSPDELAGLAKTNAESLAEFGYFTMLKANGARQAFASVRGEHMTLEGGRLTLHFELPLSAAASGRVVVLDIYDPSFFVDFQLAPEADALTLAGAPAGCAVKIARPKPAPETVAGQPDTLYQGMGAQFASRAMVACP